MELTGYWTESDKQDGHMAAGSQGGPGSSSVAGDDRSTYC